VLFLLRPRQAWMPFALPRERTQQADYRRRLNDESLAGAPYAPSRAGSPPVTDVGSLRELGELHKSGKLTDDEFAAAKSHVLDAS
jgi:hypothetical protein